MDYQLAVSIGSYYHEACLFFKKHNESLQCIYFNPNYSSKTRGVQFNRIAKEVLASLGRTLVKVQSFWSPCGNLEGLCSLLTWERIYNSVQNGDTPFDNESLNLRDYNHLQTEHTYKKYSAPEQQNGFKLLDYWQDLEKILIRNKANRMDLLKAMNTLTDIVLDEL